MRKPLLVFLLLVFSTPVMALSYASSPVNLQEVHFQELSNEKTTITFELENNHAIAAENISLRTEENIFEERKSFDIGMLDSRNAKNFSFEVRQSFNHLSRLKKFDWDLRSHWKSQIGFSILQVNESYVQVYSLDNEGPIRVWLNETYVKVGNRSDLVIHSQLQAQKSSLLIKNYTSDVSSEDSEYTVEDVKIESDRWNSSHSFSTSLDIDKESKSSDLTMDVSYITKSTGVLNLRDDKRSDQWSLSALLNLVISFLP